MQVELIALTQYLRGNGKPEELLEHAGRVCYRSESRGDPVKFLRARLREGHESLIEHASATFEISGISRACSHQLVRHRIASYCIDGDAMTELTNTNRCITRRTVKDLFDMKKNWHSKSRLRLVKLNCLDEETGRITQGRVADVVYCGQKECIEFEVEGDYRLRATKDHLFLTRQGWQRLEDALKEGYDIAVNGIPWPDKAWLHEEYLVKNRLRTDIANELGVSDAWLGKVIRSMDLQKPHGQRPNQRPGRGRPGMHTPEGKKHLSEMKKGPNNPQWKGGVTRKAVELRQRISPALRESIYERDDFTCKLCGERGGQLTLHHIVPVWQNEDLITDEQNLVTLCAACHGKVNGHEHEYADYFGSLEPVLPELRVAKHISRTIATFRPITSWKSAGVIDTYDILMEDPHHNFVANGIVTHNSQESQRYVDMSDPALIIPDAIADDPHARAVWDGFVDHVKSTYQELRELGVLKEDARFVLPNAAATRIIVTMNFRELLHFFRLRITPEAQWEIRRMAIEMLERLAPHAPAIFGTVLRDLHTEHPEFFEN
jgi:thymidylate synthase (FAD)